MQNIRKERIAIVDSGVVESLDILQVVSSMTDVYLAPSAYGGVSECSGLDQLIADCCRSWLPLRPRNSLARLVGCCSQLR